ncbi:MAG TPA: hypothetical protein VFD72_02680 [Sphingobacteriaceae bacterium]|nr:hypothetical protein [Sphingobacteriaceae bacterium]
MSSVATKLGGIVQNTKKVLERCAELKGENDRLHLDNQSLRAALEASQQKNHQLEERVKALAVARSLEQQEVLDEEDETINQKILDTKRKINDFVREIDRCIELLR